MWMSNHREEKCLARQLFDSSALFSKENCLVFPEKKLFVLSLLQFLVELAWNRIFVVLYCCLRIGEECYDVHYK